MGPILKRYLKAKVNVPMLYKPEEAATAKTTTIGMDLAKNVV
jgi:hypothetical protein